MKNKLYKIKYSYSNDTVYDMIVGAKDEEHALKQLYDRMPKCTDYSNMSIDPYNSEPKEDHFKEFIDSLSKTLNRLYRGSSDSYKEAIEDVADFVCTYLENVGYDINMLPVTEKYLSSETHRDFLRKKDLER